MKRNKLYILLLSGVLMISCTKEEGPAPVPDDDVLPLFPWGWMALPQRKVVTGTIPRVATWY